MKYNYVTIEREYGSGGTKIARELSKACDIPCYGIEILEELSKQSGISVDRLEEFEENATNSFLYSIYMIGKLRSGEINVADGASKVCLAEHEIIRKMAGEGPAIFLGHCATEAISDLKRVLKVYIIGDNATKKQRVIEDYNIDEKHAEAVMRKFDKKRSNYYNANTSKKWSDPLNYDIVINSSEIGIDGAVKLIQSLL